MAASIALRCSPEGNLWSCRCTGSTQSPRPHSIWPVGRAVRVSCSDTPDHQSCSRAATRPGFSVFLPCSAAAATANLRCMTAAPAATHRQKAARQRVAGSPAAAEAPPTVELPEAPQAARSAERRSRAAEVLATAMEDRTVAEGRSHAEEPQPVAALAQQQGAQAAATLPTRVVAAAVVAVVAAAAQQAASHRRAALARELRLEPRRHRRSR